MTRATKLFSALLLPFLFNFPVYAEALKPAGDQLKAAAGAAAVSAPEPARTFAAAEADWRAAAGKYSSKVFTPPPQRRLDVPGSELVLLQGFHWYADDYWQHPAGGWWGVLARKAPEVAAAGFDLVWFPPVSLGSYYPKEWYNLDSQWGKKEALLEAVKSMHRSGVKVLADIVLNHRNGSSNWLDFKSPDWPSNVIVNDDEVWAQPAYAALPRALYGDEGQGDFGCRDLDHRNPAVQEDSRVFLRWLKHTVGFDGWRYDMVKGYAPSHIEDYNKASSPVFTVGEYYDTDRRQITDWIDGTDSSSGKANASTAFDFTQRYALVGAVESERYELLNDNGRPSGVIGWWPAKSVTYVESHDTSPRDPNFIQNAAPDGLRLHPDPSRHPLRVLAALLRLGPRLPRRHHKAAGGAQKRGRNLHQPHADTGGQQRPVRGHHSRQEPPAGDEAGPQLGLEPGRRLDPGGQRRALRRVEPFLEIGRTPQKKNPGFSARVFFAPPLN